MAGEYGYESASERTCYAPGDPAVPTALFGDPESGEFVAVCPEVPVVYFGDR